MVDSDGVSNVVEPPKEIGLLEGSQPNLFSGDPVLQRAAKREGAEWIIDAALELGSLAASDEARAHASRAERNSPLLRTHTRSGERADFVEYDTSWDWLLRQAVEHRIHALPWRESGPGGHVARGVLAFLWSQVNAGVMCPVSMTYSAVPALRCDPSIAAKWEPRLTTVNFDSATFCGMAMTERQGGSDVRANTTTAKPRKDGTYELTGHKWFCSHPISDIFLVLAQAPGGLTCFVVEKGPGFRLQRLKDKLGTRSLASAEVEFHSLPAQRLGDEGRGVPTIIEMVNHTRLDCVTGSAAGMRRAFNEAIEWTKNRSAFGQRLIDQPLMRNVLADLALETGAATVSALRLARAFDEDDHRLRRLLTPVLKYWVCKRVTPVVAEALECLGGNGYTEEWPLAQLFRDAPLNGIWEGSGNVIALDLLRAIHKQPEILEAFFSECEQARGGNPALDGELDALPRLAQDLLAREPALEARRFAERLALVFQAATLIRYEKPAISDAFCSSRLGERHYKGLGTLGRGVNFSEVISESAPWAT